MSATVQLSIYTGAGPTQENAESGAITFGRDANRVSSAPVPKPTADGTNYAWFKTFGLHVTGDGGDTDIFNRDIYLDDDLATGLHLYFQATDTYAQPSSGNAPADNGTTNGAVPSGWTALSTTPQEYDGDPDPAVNGQVNGEYVRIVWGVAGNYAGGAGPVTMVPFHVDYDEA